MMGRYGSKNHRQHGHIALHLHSGMRLNVFLIRNHVLSTFELGLVVAMVLLVHRFVRLKSLTRIQQEDCR
jgi:hypothetical protein